MPNSYDRYPDMVIDPAASYVATLETSSGTIELALFADRAPKTVNNFVFLAQEGYYDGLTFHRVIDDFMIQGGCPRGDGRGGPGYQWDDEASALAIPHEAGVLSMANAGPNTNGSQFFITHIATDWLNGKHAVFGKVTSAESKAVVDAVRGGDTIQSITITKQ